MKIAIIGATGAVGREIINCLYKLNFPLTKLRLTASERSKGQVIETPFGQIEIETPDEEIFQDSDIAIFAAGASLSKELAPIAKKHSCLVIDNSSAFRYDKNVPLIIPEINPQEAQMHTGIIANPNCTTAIAAVALWPLHQNFTLKKIIISTYQATSGAGKQGMDELINQTRSFLNNEPEQVEHFQHKIAFNIIPHIDSFQENGYTREELKVVWEIRKIFNQPDLEISCTAVRIPTLRAHCESIVIETEKDITPEAARAVLSQAKGVKIVDDIAKNIYPMPRNASQQFDVQVGRIRQNLIFKNKGLEFFISGDQLLKGAALNAVQIAQLFVREFAAK